MPVMNGKPVEERGALRTVEGSKTHLKYGSSLNALWIHRAAPAMSSDLIFVISVGMVCVVDLAGIEFHS